MSTLIKTKRKQHPGNNNARQKCIYAKSLDTVAAQGVHYHYTNPALTAPLNLRLQAILRRKNAIGRRRSAPDGTNQAKMPESTQNLPEQIEAKTAPSPPTTASEEDLKMKPFLPVFNETNQPPSSRERIHSLLHIIAKSGFLGTWTHDMMLRYYYHTIHKNIYLKC